MIKVQRVELESAPKELGEDGRPYLDAAFKLLPAADGIWSDIFRYNLYRFNELKKAERAKQNEDQGFVEPLDEPIIQIEINEGKSALAGSIVVSANCHSADQIETLHESLKQLVRETNADYPKAVERIRAADARDLEQQKKIEALKKTLKAEI